MPGQTPSQTVGPFFDFGLIFHGQEDLQKGDPAGTRITIRGRVFDGDGEPVPEGPATSRAWGKRPPASYDSKSRHASLSQG